jgi:hypothetical protein
LCTKLWCAVSQQELAFALLFSKKLNNDQISKQFRIQTTLDYSPTAGHLIGHIERVLNLFNGQSAYWDNQSQLQALEQPKVQQCLTTLYQKELAESAAGRLTFVHAQQWKWEWYAWLYKKLYETVTGTQISNYQFLRFNRIKKPSEQKEDNIYTNLKNYGRAHGFRNRLFFLNAGLFGNTTNIGSCSMDYWNHNGDMSHLRHDTYKVNNSYIFNKFNLSALYTKYQQQLNQLEAEHQALTQRGNFLLVSLSKELAQSHVFMASCPGYKYSVFIDGTQTDDTLQFFATLKKDPTKISETDCIEFCLILTKPHTLRPSPGFQIFAFNDIDPTTWQAFCTKRDNLFAHIKKDIQKLKKEN